MKKEHLYACMCVFFVTLSICAIVVTITFRNRMTKPVATISDGGYITYEVPVETPYRAARIFYKLQYGKEEAQTDEYRYQQRKDANERFDK